MTLMAGEVYLNRGLVFTYLGILQDPFDVQGVGIAALLCITGPWTALVRTLVVCLVSLVAKATPLPQSLPAPFGSRCIDEGTWARALARGPIMLCLCSTGPSYA